MKISLFGSNFAAANTHTVYTPSTPGGGVKMSKHVFFSESSNVACPITRELSIEHHASTYSIPNTHLQPLEWSQIIFLKVVMLHIKLKGIEPRAPHKHIFFPYTHLGPCGGVKKSIHFSESSHVAYQIKGHILSLHTFSTCRAGSKGQKKSESSHVAYQIKGNRAPYKYIFCLYRHHQPELHKVKKV